MPKTSEVRKEERKKRILDSAEVVFGNKGYSQTSIDDIVSHSGISKGGIYTYYDSKEAIFLAIAEQRFIARNQQIKLFSHEESASVQIERYIRWLLESLDQPEMINRSRFSFEFWTILSRESSKSELARERYSKFEFDLAQIIQRGIDQKEFREDLDVRIAIQILLSSMDGMGFMSTVMGKPVSEKAISEFVVMFLTHWRRLDDSVL